MLINYLIFFFWSFNSLRVFAEVEDVSKQKILLASDNSYDVIKKTRQKNIVANYDLSKILDEYDSDIDIFVDLDEDRHIKSRSISKLVKRELPSKFKKKKFANTRRRIKNFIRGFGLSFKEAGTGIYSLIRHPHLTAVAIKDAVVHPTATMNYISQVMKNMTKKGNRSEMLGRALADLVMAFAAAQILKNVATVSKGVMGIQKMEVIRNALANPMITQSMNTALSPAARATYKTAAQRLSKVIKQPGVLKDIVAQVENKSVIAARAAQ